LCRPYAAERPRLNPAAPKPKKQKQKSNQIPNAHERGQCYSVFNIDGERMASYYAPVSRLEDALLGGAAAGPRRALAEKAAAATEAERQHRQQRQQQPQPASNGAADDPSNPLAFLARFFFPPSQ
jgi:hypothetical protein